MQRSVVRIFREPPRFLRRCDAVRVMHASLRAAFDRTLKIAWLIMFHVGSSDHQEKINDLSVEDLGSQPVRDHSGRWQS
jgi:hypothetical protein